MRLLLSQIARLEPTEGASVEAVVAGATATEIAFSLPDLTAVPAALARGRKLGVWFWDQHGLYRGETMVVRHAKAVMPTLIVSQLSEVRTRQQRRLLRLPVRLSTNVAVLETARADAKNEADQGAIAEDLSGGGMRLVAALPLAADDRLALEVTIDEGAAPLRVAGKVLRATPHPRLAARWVASVMFVDLSEADKSALIRALFELQRR